MAISLHDATVAGFIQGMQGLEGVLAKGLAFCEAAGVDPETIVETRLREDMLPFRYQVVATAHHSIKAIEGVRAGLFEPPRKWPPLTYVQLQEKAAETRAALKTLDPDEVNALAGRDVEFRLGDMSMPFTAEGFLLSFSVPNFHFHATTAYDILRQAGAPLAKRDFLGRLRMKA